MTKAEEKKLADLRNKIGAIYAHFQLRIDLEQIIKNNSDLGITADQRLEKLKRISTENEIVARESMATIKKILDSFG